MENISCNLSAWLPETIHTTRICHEITKSPVKWIETRGGPPDRWKLEVIDLQGPNEYLINMLLPVLLWSVTSYLMKSKSAEFTTGSKICWIGAIYWVFRVLRQGFQVSSGFIRRYVRHWGVVKRGHKQGHALLRKPLRTYAEYIKMTGWTITPQLYVPTRVDMNWYQLVAVLGYTC